MPPDAAEQLKAVQDELVRVLRTLPGLNVLEREPIGVVAEMPFASLRWLGPTKIVDAATGLEQDVTHTWRLELTVSVETAEEERAQDDLRELVQRATSAIRGSVNSISAPNLGTLVDLVRVSLDQPADYFRRATLTGEAQGPMLYGCVLRVECDYTEA
jgi:hypothetical protein